MNIKMVVVNVTDFSIAKKFYCDFLGLKLKNEFPQALVFQQEGPDLVMHLVKKNAKPAYPDIAQTVLVFETDDIDSDMKRLNAVGVRFLHENPVSATPGRFAAFCDPFGNVHELLQTPQDI